MTIWIVAGLVALAVPAGVSAADSPLSPSQIVTEAMQNNGELRALREELEIRAAEEARAGIHPDPVIDMGVETGSLTRSKGEDRYSAGVSREFLTFGKGKLRRAVAGKDLESARARVSDSERLLKFQVKERLFALLLAREKTTLARKTVELDQELVRIAEERFSAGDVAEVEVQMARVEAARAKEGVLLAEREEVPHLAALARLMGLSSPDVPAVQGTLSTHEVEVTPESLTERALLTRPDLRAQTLELEAGETAVALARAEGRPNITAGISYSHERSVTEVDSLEEDSADNLVGLHLSVPFPVSGRRESLLREANARKGAAQLRLTALRATVSRDVQSARTRLGSAEASVELYRNEILPRVEQNLEIVQKAYRLGESGILNVIEERRKFHDVNSGYLQALHDWNHALATLEAAVGSDLSDIEGEQR